MKKNLSNQEQKHLVESTNIDIALEEETMPPSEEEKETDCDIVSKKEESLKKKNLIHRLHRIEGQIRGIQKMIQEDRDCVDIITQVSASLSALENVSLIILEKHIKTYFQNMGVDTMKEQSIDVLLEAIRRVLK